MDRQTDLQVEIDIQMLKSNFRQAVPNKVTDETNFKMKDSK